MKTVKTYPSLPSIKIGGMKNKEERIPLYGSIRFCVTGVEDSIYTKTSCSVSEDIPENEVYINGIRVGGKQQQRVEYIFNELISKAELKNMKFKLESENIGYPTGGGLASSASGLGAATLSFYEAIRDIDLEFYLDKKELSRIARLGSSTAVGSVIGSYSELVISEDDAWGTKIAEPIALPNLYVAVALITGGKESDQIHRAMETSRYRSKRIDFVNETLPKVRAAILCGDAQNFIKYTHEDTKNFHAAILDQGILTFEAQTIPIFRKIEELRNDRIDVGCSIAGGPTPIILATADKKDHILRNLEDELSDIELVECKIAGEPEVIT